MFTRKLQMNYLFLRHKYSFISPFFCGLRDATAHRRYNYNKMGLPVLEIVKKLQNIAPLKLAETWDNVGILIEPERNRLITTILLTIDLTEDVVDEAVASKVQMIVTYHPNIFQPMKCITQSHWKERIAIKCIKNDIIVYSPHTTWDAMLDGVNDWLASSLNPKSSRPILGNKEDSNVGMGRLITLQNPFSLKHVIEKIKQHIGIPYVRVGIAKHKDLERPSLVETINIHPVSGARHKVHLDLDMEFKENVPLNVDNSPRKRKSFPVRE